MHIGAAAVYSVRAEPHPWVKTLATHVDLLRVALRQVLRQVADTVPLPINASRGGS